MARTAETLRLAIPRRACSPAFSGYSPSTVATPIPRPSAPSSSLADSLTLTTPDVFGLDERFLDPLTAPPVRRVLPQPSDRGDRSQSSLLSSTTLASHPLSHPLL